MKPSIMASPRGSPRHGLPPTRGSPDTGLPPTQGSRGWASQTHSICNYSVHTPRIESQLQPKMKAAYVTKLVCNVGGGGPLSSSFKTIHDSLAHGEKRGALRQRAAAPWDLRGRGGLPGPPRSRGCLPSASEGPRVRSEATWISRGSPVL